MDAVGEFLDRVIELLQTDADYVVRAGAARALGSWDSPRTRQALREAMLDRSVAVQQAAEEALAGFNRSAWGAGVSDWDATLASWNHFAEEA
jgi:HEAT repeat protein